MNNIELKKRFEFFSAVCDIVQIWGETEIGTCEVDEEVVANYCCSDKFWKDHFNCHTKEDIYEKLTNDIINGFPVWEFLKLSDWTKEMLEKSFATEQTEKWKELCKTYKCYTCEYYHSEDTGLGLYEKCKKPKDDIRQRGMMRKREIFEVKKNCKHYKKALVN